jgi:hypothetical protein
MAEICQPLPGRLAALMRRLRADRDERSGGEPSRGASATETSSRVGGRGRPEPRSLTAALFEDEQMDVIECEIIWRAPRRSSAPSISSPPFSTCVRPA